MAIDPYRQARMARKGRTVLVLVVLAGCGIQLTGVAIKCEKLLDAAKPLGVSSISDLLSLANVQHDTRESVSTLELTVIREVDQIYYDLSLLVIVSAFCVAVIPLLRAVEKLGSEPPLGARSSSSKRLVGRDC